MGDFKKNKKKLIPCLNVFFMKSYSFVLHFL
jgi:hypothetical protein